MIALSEKTCPRCHSRDLKTWSELSPDDIILAERLPMSAEYTQKERKKHRICTRCWFEETKLETQA